MRRRKQSFALVLLLIFFIIQWPSIAASSQDTLLTKAAEQAKRATIGVLQPHTERGSNSMVSPFSIRGSGTHIGNGYLLTAQHAIERQEGGRTIAPETIHVITDNLHELEATLVGINDFLDIAVYRLLESSRLALPDGASFSQSESLAGDEVFTVGYPLGWGPALSFGRVGNPNTFLETIQSRLLQIDLSACSGNSGGGLFNTKGEIVGVIHAIIQTETTRGERRCSRFAFAVPGRIVQKIVHALIDGSTPKFSKLGVTLGVVKRDQQWTIAVGKATGPARQAGFKKGDIFLAINDQPIQTATQLKNYLIEHTEPGQQVSITVLRNQKTRTLKVILGS